MRVLKFMSFLLVAIILFGFTQTPPKKSQTNITGKFVRMEKSGRNSVATKLEINKDSTYKDVFGNYFRPIMESNGKWKINGDTLVLMEEPSKSLVEMTKEFGYSSVEEGLKENPLLATMTPVTSYWYIANSDTIYYLFNKKCLFHLYRVSEKEYKNFDVGAFFASLRNSKKSNN